MPAEESVRIWEGELLALIAAGQHQAVMDAFWGLESFNGFAQVALSGAQHTPLATPPPLSLGSMMQLPSQAESSVRSIQIYIHEDAHTVKGWAAQ